MEAHSQDFGRCWGLLPGCGVADSVGDILPLSLSCVLTMTLTLFAFSVLLCSLIVPGCYLEAASGRQGRDWIPPQTSVGLLCTGPCS